VYESILRQEEDAARGAGFYRDAQSARNARIQGLRCEGSGRIGTAPGKGYIKGKYPTAAELEELLKRTIHKVMERELVERFEMKKIGDRKIHVPMVGLKTAGEDRMVITDKEIFGEDTRVYPREKQG
jgi:hypothetical protein